MNLANKKQLAAKVLGVGKGRLIFVESHLSEIKEAITRQDITDLHKSGAIKIKEISGRKTLVKRKHRRRTGKVKKTVNGRKQEYVIITRKLRTFLNHLVKTGKLDKEKYASTRKMIRARKFKSKRHLNESIGDL
jgi:large subunit ribosomal protein L19e